MNFKIYSFWLILSISTSIYCQDNYSKIHIDSSLNAISKIVVEDPNYGLQISTKLYNASVKNNYEIGQSLALVRMAQGNSSLGNYDKAIELAKKSNLLAKKINNDSLLLYSDFVTAIQYGRMRLNKKALQLLDDCEAKVHSLNNNSQSVFLGKLYSFKAFFSEGLDKPLSRHKIIELHHKAAFYFKKNKKNNLGAIYYNIGSYHLFLNNIDSTEYYFLKSIEEDIRFNSPKNYMTMCNLAEVYYLKGKYFEAKEYLDSSNIIALNNKDYYVLKTNCNLYARLYQKIGKIDAAIKFQLLESNYKDSIATVKENQMIKSTNYIANSADKEKEHMISTKMKIIFSGIVIVIVIFGFACFQIFIKKRIKKQAQLKDVEIINTKEEIRNKESQIINLKQKVTTSYDEVIQMAKKNDPLFVSFFKELYPEFYDKLMKIQPDLTITEQKVCFYLKLKFSTKEIADYTFVTTKAIQNRKNRLRKRFHLNEGDDLYLWIDTL